ncbi:hypothetical protein M407DRAFT_228192 [Tulasnella calospora MUT 4182]|uniref:Uncharacterized protein n=1 Tax=Tulasnella calospora MUT 4182 TaxID=1051891 RepID=A0A0C3L5U1_9AGAM|nr:hypothetical protein M407DRAFT_228192 [Tulasnella calospora MUT 4182]
MIVTRTAFSLKLPRVRLFLGIAYVAIMISGSQTAVPAELERVAWQSETWRLHKIGNLQYIEGADENATSPKNEERTGAEEVRNPHPEYEIVITRLERNQVERAKSCSSDAHMNEGFISNVNVKDFTVGLEKGFPSAFLAIAKTPGKLELKGGSNAICLRIKFGKQSHKVCVLHGSSILADQFKNPRLRSNDTETTEARLQDNNTSSYCLDLRAALKPTVKHQLFTHFLPPHELSYNITPSTSSQSGKVVPENIEGWRRTVAEAVKVLQEASALLSSIEKAITETTDQAVDKGVINSTYSGLVKTMKEIVKVQEILGDHVELEAGGVPLTESGACRIRQFSNMKWEDLPSIGVKMKPRVLPIVTLRLKLLADRATDQSYTSPADKIIGSVLGDLVWWINALNFHSEASARVIVDICLLAVLKLASHINFNGTSQGKIIICPELLLSNSMNTPEVVADQDITKMTVLSGSTDYAVAYIPGWANLLDDAREKTQGIALQPRYSLKGLLGLKPEGESLAQFRDTARLLLSLIETKRAGTKGTKLLDALPQVIAQAVVTGIRSQPKDTSPLQIPFVLTNGFEWIFAALKHEPSADGGDDWTCIRTEPHIIPKIGLMEEASEEDINQTKKALSTVVDVLVHWICLERDVIIDQLAECEILTTGKSENIET